MRVPLLAWPAVVVWGVLALIVPVDPYRVPAAPGWAIDIRHGFATTLAQFGETARNSFPVSYWETPRISRSLFETRCGSRH